jgi:hypothetical protein
MSRKFIRGCALSLLVAAPQAFAASIYTFSGQLTAFFIPDQPVPQAYIDQGMGVGAPITVQISLDAQRTGYSYSLNDGITNLSDSYFWNGSILDQRWVRYAEVIDSNVIDPASTSQHYYQNAYQTTSPSSISSMGSILVDDYFMISKSAPFVDDSVFVENWKVGDSLELDLYYDKGLGGATGYGRLTLISISNPLPSVSQVSPVPLPGAGMLFAAGLAGMMGARRVRAARVASAA